VTRVGGAPARFDAYRSGANSGNASETNGPVRTPKFVNLKGKLAFFRAAVRLTGRERYADNLG